ncbi:MAG: hypothetical protein CME06_02345 [Gemmatimonadetes bacterium]|nr:hypothetical protein [Gemmatimonadota bacterium]
MDEHQAHGVTLADYVRIIWSRKWMVGLVATAVLAFTIFFTLRMQPVYESQTTLLIEPQDAGALSIFDPTGFMKQKILINNECELLRSRSLAQQVLDRAMREGWTPPPESDPMADWVEALRSRLSVSPLKDADVITIKMTAGDPDEAAYFANLFAEEYRNQNISQNRGELSGVRQFLEEQLHQVETRLAISEEELRSFKTKSGLVSLSDEVEWLVRQLAEFESAENAAITDQKSLERRLEHLEGELERARAGLVEDLDDAAASPLVIQLREQLVALQIEHTSLLVRGASEDSPQIIDLESKVKQAKTRLAAETQKIVDRDLLPGDPLLYSQGLVEKVLELRTELETARSRAAELNRFVADYATKLHSLPDKELALARKTREYTVNENTYLMMKEKYEEVRISEAGEIGNVRIIDAALPFLDPVRPNRRMNALLGLVVGLGLALSLAFFFEYLDTSLRTIDEVEQKLDTVVLGAVAALEEAAEAEDESARLVTLHEPQSPMAEAYRTIRTNVGFAAVGAPLRSIAITSSGPQEGKSTTASNLAITIAQSGKRTLLLDADLRRPVLHKLFSLKRQKGVTDHLAGNATLEEVIQKTEIEGLHVITSGSLPPNPSELLGSDAMARFIEEVGREFDQIIVDTPPVMAVTDALLLSALLDGVIIIVEAGETLEQVAKRTKTLVETAARRCLGVVLNNVDVGGGYGRYGGYHYHYHYHEDADNKTNSRATSIWRAARGVAIVATFFAIAAAMWHQRRPTLAEADTVESRMVPNTEDGRIAGLEEGVVGR